jgi:hypothetical protein
MANCEKCGVEIIGKSYTRIKYRWKSRMLVQYCKYCYLKTEDDKGLNPAVFTLFMSIATLLEIWIILFASWMSL